MDDGGLCAGCRDVPDTVDCFVRVLSRHVLGSMMYRRRVVSEVREHLHDRVRWEQEAGASPGEAQRRATASLGSPSVLAASFPARGISRLAILVTTGMVVMAAVVGGAAIDDGQVTPLSSTHAFPNREFALLCVKHWNAQANARIRAGVVGKAPLTYRAPWKAHHPPQEITTTNGLGQPVEAHFEVGVGCRIAISFLEHQVWRTVLFQHRTPRAEMLGPSDGRHFVGRARVLADGRLATAVQPPRGMRWHSLRVSVTVLKHSVPIQGPWTCVPVTVTSNRWAYLSPGHVVPTSRANMIDLDNPATPRASWGVRTLRPRTPISDQVCIHWGTFAAHPLTEFPGLPRPDVRAIHLFAMDRLQRSATVDTTLIFRIVPNRASHSRGSSRARWRLVFEPRPT